MFSSPLFEEEYLHSPGGPDLALGAGRKAGVGEKCRLWAEALLESFFFCYFFLLFFCAKKLFFTRFYHISMLTMC